MIDDTIKAENQRRARIRTLVLSIGTPLILIIFIVVMMIVNTLITTVSAVKKFESPEGNYEEVFSTVEDAAFTSTFMEGYLAKYNFATALAKADPTRTQDAIMIYLEIIPQSPPSFICYPVLNAVYYSEKLGDEYATLGDAVTAELYYNYAEHYISYAPQCLSSPPPNNPDDSEQDENQSQSPEDKMDGLKEKQEQMREAQGKPTNPSQSGSQKEREDQIQEKTDRSEQVQKETEKAREEESKGNPPDNPTVDKPW